MSYQIEALFLRVVERGSLKAVAQEVGSNPSAVSRKIAALEQRLGARLLLRSTKGSQPTEAGRRYYEGMRQIIDATAALEADVAGLVDRPLGLLRVAAPVDFGARFVAPVLAQLQDEAPGLEIDLRLGSEFTELVEQGIDVAIRIGTLTSSALIARKLGTVSRVIVAAPGYLERHGKPVSPRDLADHPFILYAPGARTLTFDVGVGEHAETVTVRGTFSVNSVGSIQRLVLAERGLHLGPRWAFEEWLKDGRLTTVLPDYVLRGFPLYALYTPSAFLPAKSRRFIDLMATSVKSEAALN